MKLHNIAPDCSDIPKTKSVREEVWELLVDSTEGNQGFGVCQEYVHTRMQTASGNVRETGWIPLRMAQVTGDVLGFIGFHLR